MCPMTGHISVLPIYLQRPCVGAVFFLKKEVIFTLTEITLTGEIDRVQIAIDRLRMFADKALENHPNGYMICDSGGKDSDVIKAIAYFAGIKFEIVHSHTTADHPLTVRYVREQKTFWLSRGIPYSVIYPTYKGQPASMWSLIPL